MFDGGGEPTSETVTFTVEEGSADAPGFAVLAAIATLAAGALVLRRR